MKHFYRSIIIHNISCYKLNVKKVEIWYSSKQSHNVSPSVFFPRYYADCNTIFLRPFFCLIYQNLHLYTTIHCVHIIYFLLCLILDNCKCLCDHREFSQRLFIMKRVNLLYFWWGCESKTKMNSGLSNSIYSIYKQFKKAVNSKRRIFIKILHTK